MKKWDMTFYAEGMNLEKLIRAAGEHGIRITSVKRVNHKRIQAQTCEDNLAQLAVIADKGGWIITPGRRLGLGKLLENAVGRRMLCMAVAAIILCCILCTQVVWYVELEGAGTYRADLMMTLEEMGISAPMLRAKIDPASIRQALEWRYPRVAWFECGWRGMGFVVRAVEGVIPMDEDAAAGTCDIIAARAGIVERTVTKAGTPLVKAGDLVMPGQVLIKGEERTAEGEVRAVAARGNVYARVWDCATVSASLYETETQYSGRTQTVYQAVCPWFPLWHTEPSGYTCQDVHVRTLPLGGFFLPLTLRQETRMEASITQQARSIDELKTELEAGARQKLLEKAGGKESLVDNWVNWSIIDDEILLAEAICERVVDIAQQERDSGMTATE